MGSCCSSNSPIHPSNRYKKNGISKLPKTIILPEHSAVVYYEKWQTDQSSRLKYLLKNHFSTISIIDGEKRLLNRMASAEEKWIYLILTNKLHEENVKSLLKNRKIKGIYLTLNESNLKSYRQSTKLKGFYEDFSSLKRAIYFQIRSDHDY